MVDQNTKGSSSKKTISERWGKQICLNQRLLARVGKLLKAPRDESRSIFLNNADVTRYLPINQAKFHLKSQIAPWVLETNHEVQFKSWSARQFWRCTPFAQAVAVVQCIQRQRSTVIFRQSAITNLGIAINPLQPEEAPLNRASHRCFRVFQLPFYVHAFDERLTKFASKVLTD